MSPNQTSVAHTRTESTSVATSEPCRRAENAGSNFAPIVGYYMERGEDEYGIYCYSCCDRHLAAAPIPMALAVDGMYRGAYLDEISLDQRCDGCGHKFVAETSCHAA